MCIDNYNILSNTVLLVEEGLGVAVCLNGALAIHHSPQLRFVPLVPERPIRGVLIWKKNHVFNPATSLFVQMVQRYGESERYYPTPLVVVGTMVNGKPNWVLVGHLGIMGHDHVMVSLAKSHYTNQGIKETKALTINIVDEALLPLADRAGCVSGAKEDKSQLFAYTIGESGAPMIDNAPVVMECQVEDVYETPGFDNFVCTIRNTFAEESALNEQGKLDYHTLKPVLFEMPTYEYLKTGDVLAKCMSFGKAAQ